MPDTVSGTITFLFTDIEGGVPACPKPRLWEEYPEAMRAAPVQHDDLLRTCIESHGGRILTTVGDAFCAVFSEPRPAIDTVLACQQWLPALALNTDAGPQPLKVRMALHTGVAEAPEGDYFGQPLFSTTSRRRSAGPRKDWRSQKHSMTPG